MASRRSSWRALQQWFEGNPCPIYVVDGNRRIVYLNRRCAEWLGLEGDELLGVRCDYSASEGEWSLQSVACALCPSPAVFLGEQRSAVLCVLQRGGGKSNRRATFLAVPESGGDSFGVVAVVSDEELQPEQGPLSEDPSAEQLHQRLQQWRLQIRAPYRLDRLAGSSPAMLRLRRQIELAMKTSVHVQLVGPVGSGREHVARTIHRGDGSETVGPLMPLSCDGLEAELLQTAILAFLERCRDQTGSHGTLLLLEADQLNGGAQAELLAFLRLPTFPLRILATTRRPFMELAVEDCYDRELAERLSVFVISVPGLAERREDIPILAQQLLEERNARGGIQITGFAPDVLDQLSVLPWPGNVRQLAEVVHGACERASGPVIRSSDLPEEVRHYQIAAAWPARSVERIKLDEFLAEVERELIERAMKQAKGNKAEAARLLGIPRARLLRKLRPDRGGTS